MQAATSQSLQHSALQGGLWDKTRRLVTSATYASDKAFLIGLCKTGCLMQCSTGLVWLIAVSGSLGLYNFVLHKL